MVGVHPRYTVHERAVVFQVVFFFFSSGVAHRSKLHTALSRLSHK